LLKPDLIEALVNQGNILKELNRLEEAILCYEKAIQLDPLIADTRNNYAITLQLIGRLHDAIDNFNLAIELRKDYVEAYTNRGNVLKMLKNYEQALSSYEDALSINPDYAEAHNNRGLVLQEMNRLNEALESIKNAISINPLYAEAFCNQGNILMEMKYFDQSLESYNKSISINASDPSVYNNRGNVLKELHQYYDAKKSYEQAIQLKPDQAASYNNLGNLLQELGFLDLALENYTKVNEINASYIYLSGAILYLKILMCKWDNLESNRLNLIEKVHGNEKVALNFQMIALSGSLHSQKKVSEIYFNSTFGVESIPYPSRKITKTEKIRIAYFSADFREHAVSQLLVELIETHNRNNFEITAFSFGPETKDKMQLRLLETFDHFLDVRFKSDTEVVRLSREMGVDIAIDLNGGTAGNRIPVFANRAAPIQINYLGYPGTMGAQCFDYIISDATVIPVESQNYYSEKIIYLPNCYLPYDSTRQISKLEKDKADFELPSDAFVYCCFNASYKITPKVFESWMRILKATDGSVLWLSSQNQWATANLKRETEKRGINQNRLIFAEKLPSMADHLARQQLADLFLDTSPYNAHTTALDALWAGLPILTCPGESFASRAASSALRVIDMPELIADSLEHYESIAIELAKNPTKIKEIKEKIERNKFTSRLFDTKTYTSHLETAYKIIYERYHKDSLPEHIYIES